MRSLFKKFKEGLSKSAKSFAEKTGGIFRQAKLDASSIEELEEALYAADFGYETTEEIIEETKQAYRKNKDLRGKDVAAIGSAVLRRVLEGSEGTIDFKDDRPTVICLIGVNGSGKTTTTAKLGSQCKAEGRQVLVAACDTFRAAATEQLREWSNRLDLDMVSGERGSDAAAVAYDSWQAAKSRGKDTLIVDTAGRLHTKSNLMDELAKIRRVLQKHDETAPHYSLLVVDGSLGSNSIEQARVFHEKFGLDGLIVTKLDGTSRGGSLVGIYRELKLPIYFLGLGEKAEDLQAYQVGNYVDAVFGVG
ncbi:MAG: signal recognition particle-docking protein FtsY [Opitutales bacterium]|jgi:fused signal recognition particle receptor|nr:signal recognition particle-docking protein FtsY [Opitutales bacterium]MBT5816082.1 signal recognition particle-docking protein FtsY [Opitutales bacterium]MBT6770723.1 signal recognition particle-docking protein FtsY [Opitutales bacterium]MDG2254343.1 signal recognition particle-docking protein FtsY [Opitutaceae bacterium]